MELIVKFLKSQRQSLASMAEGLFIFSQFMNESKKYSPIVSSSAKHIIKRLSSTNIQKRSYPVIQNQALPI